MFGEILKSYGAMFRLGMMAAVLAGAAGYVLYLRWEVHSYKEDLATAHQVSEECESKMEQLGSSVKIYEENLKALQDYYRTRKHLDIKDGELKPEEILTPAK